MRRWASNVGQLARRVWASKLPESLAIYYLTTLLVVAGVSFGFDFIPRREFGDFPGYAITQPEPTFLGAFANWDGVWHRDIVENGYSYDPAEGSYVVFFPGYPLLARGVVLLTGLDSVVALLVVSHLAFLGCLWLLPRYVRERFPDAPSAVAQWTQWALALSPISFFFRVAYAESLFCLLVLLVLYGVQRRWPFLVVALLIGAATGVRAVGVALLPVMLFYLWDLLSTNEAALSARLPSRRALVWTAPICLPLCVWGLAGFMLYLHLAFGDALAFQRNHVRFNDTARMNAPLGERLWHLATLEPIWAAYVPGTKRYWGTHNPIENALFVLQAIDPLYFVGVAATVLIGWRQRLLNRHELILAMLLLLIPYATKGHDNAMKGHARYALAAVPAYWVVGHWAAWVPDSVRQPALAFSSGLLALYAALFAAWHLFI